MPQNFEYRAIVPIAIVGLLVLLVAVVVVVILATAASAVRSSLQGCSMSLSFIIGFLTAIVSGVFAYLVLNRYRLRGGTHLLMWGLGLVGLWSSRYGTFAPRPPDPPVRAGRGRRSPSTGARTG